MSTTRNTAAIRKNSGFTLLEISMVLAIMTLVVGALFAMSIGIGDTARIQESQTRMHEEARAAIQAIATELRQAQVQSITSAMPGETLTYRLATDLDGNGTAVDRQAASRWARPAPSSATSPT